MVDQWEPVHWDSIKTPLEVPHWNSSQIQEQNCSISFLKKHLKPVPLVKVYLELQLEGYLVDYERVPVTDEKSPKETDFDILVSFHSLYLK